MSRQKFLEGPDWWKVLWVTMILVTACAGYLMTRADDRCVEVGAGVLVCQDAAPEGFTDGPDPSGLKTCTPERIVAGERCVIYSTKARKPTEMSKRRTITDDAEPHVNSCKTSPLGWVDCRLGFSIVDDPDPTSCTGMECSLHATRSCGIQGVSMLLFVEDRFGQGSCIYRCPNDQLPHNVFDCGAGTAPSAPMCCGECPGGCVDPDTGQPLPWPCCPADDPDPGDVTK